MSVCKELLPLGVPPVERRPTWEVTPMGDLPVGGRVEAVVVSGGQVNHTMEELVGVFCDQLFLEGVATGSWKREAEGRFSEERTSKLPCY